MAPQPRFRTRLRHGIPVLLALGALGIGACSSGSNTAATDGDKSSTTTPKKSDPTRPGDRKPTGKAAEAKSLIPVDADAPDGYRMVTAKCPATDAASKADDATNAERYRSSIVFAVPESWESMGLGTGGSGGVLGTKTTLGFDTKSAERVTVEYDWDTFTVDGGVADYQGKPWKSFDYDITKNDETSTITYDKVGTVTVGDQDVDLFYADPAQAPDDLISEQYKARIAVLEVPRSTTEPDVARTHSIVVTIEFSPEVTEVTQDILEKIIGSYGMPTCTWDDVVKSQELQLQMDLDGDGTVMTPQEYQKEIQEQLDEMQKKQQSQQRGE